MPEKVVPVDGLRRGGGDRERQHAGDERAGIPDHGGERSIRHGPGNVTPIWLDDVRCYPPESPRTTTMREAADTPSREIRAESTSATTTAGRCITARTRRTCGCGAREAEARKSPRRQQAEDDAGAVGDVSRTHRQRHDGTSNAFEVHLDLGTEPANGVAATRCSCRRRQGGQAERARESANGTVIGREPDATGANQNRRWIITIEPRGNKDVTVVPSRQPRTAAAAKRDLHRHGREARERKASVQDRRTGRARESQRPRRR